METNSSTISRCIVDNWMLELVHSLLQDGVVYARRFPLSPYSSTGSVHESYLRAMENEDKPQSTGMLFLAYNSMQGRSLMPTNFVEFPNQFESFLSLSQLLDLMICNDELVYDSEMSWVWDSTEAMSVISPLMNKIKLGKKTKEKLTTMWEYSSSKYPPIVWEGALYYLGLSQLLGVNYWPSPDAVYLLGGDDDA